MSAAEPLGVPAPSRRTRSRTHLRPVSGKAQRAEETSPLRTDAAVPVPVPTADIPGLSSQLTNLERELRNTWKVMLELDAATAGRVGHAGRLVHRAAAVLSDHSVIY